MKARSSHRRSRSVTAFVHGTGCGESLIAGEPTRLGKRYAKAPSALFTPWPAGTLAANPEPLARPLRPDALQAELEHGVPERMWVVERFGLVSPVAAGRQLAVRQSTGAGSRRDTAAT